MKELHWDDLPPFIKEFMLQEQYEQQKFRDADIFRQQEITGGFDWERSKAGSVYWVDVLINRNFILPKWISIFIPVGDYLDDWMETHFKFLNKERTFIEFKKTVLEFYFVKIYSPSLFKIPILSLAPTGGLLSVPTHMFHDILKGGEGDDLKLVKKLEKFIAKI